MDEVFRAALADAFLRIDRYPDAPWTTDALLGVLREALDDLRINRNIEQTDYDRTRLLIDDLTQTIAVLRELIDEP